MPSVRAWEPIISYYPSVVLVYETYGPQEYRGVNDRFLNFDAPDTYSINKSSDVSPEAQLAHTRHTTSIVLAQQRSRCPTGARSQGRPTHASRRPTWE